MEAAATLLAVHAARRFLGDGGQGRGGDGWDWAGEDGWSTRQGDKCMPRLPCCLSCSDTSTLSTIVPMPVSCLGLWQEQAQSLAEAVDHVAAHSAASQAQRARVAHGGLL